MSDGRSGCRHSQGRRHDDPGGGFKFKSKSKSKSKRDRKVQGGSIKGALRYNEGAD